MSLIKTEKRAVTHLAVRLDNQLVAVAGAVNRERQSVPQSSQFFLKLVFIATFVLGRTGKPLQDALCRCSTVFFHTAAIKLANQSFALH